ncbi:MCE family protein [Wohlfahrtiimonas chitiniclastica]|uniref:MlaD family protein n=1 Tax=Wohlfahrtiimonas chitiniclastica TaxID=400946 RepID=UPI000B993A56|nr:MlaD family protein [Wohlfahrtiimonas chitiniclastica]OYQ77421.1 MCE family protein [Wohlfahrtiimonas chitiniclastica]
MENKFSFAAVGVFVVGFSIALLALVVWLTVGTDKVKYLPYKVVTNESVAGLSVNSVVDYKGVDVGVVRKIELNDLDPRYVIISLDIAAGTPIKSDTEAVLTSRGITGLVGVSLRGGTESAPNVVPTESDPVPEIKNGPSLSQRLDTAFNDATRALSGVSEKLDMVLTTQNAEHVNNILRNLDVVTSNFAESSEDLKEMADDATKFFRGLEPKIDRALSAIDSFSAIAENVKTASDGLTSMLDNADSTLKAWGATAVEWRNFGQSVRSQVPNLNSTFTELNNVLYQMSLLITQLNNQPNSLIMGKGKPKPGPGE